jgi:hypothetical protein
VGSHDTIPCEIAGHNSEQQSYLRELEKGYSGPYLQRGGQLVIGNYRPISLTSEVGKQMEHAIAGYLRQIWERSEWLYKDQHGFRPGYSCESQIVTVHQDIADALDEGARTDKRKLLK